MKLEQLAILEDINRLHSDPVRREVCRRARQHLIVSEARSPQTGIYWWGPIKAGWKLFPFFEEYYGSLQHDEMWGKWADTILGRNSIGYGVRDAYAGLPRGRVVKELSNKGSETGRWFILHGDDTPISDGLELVASAFNIPPDKMKFVYDDHERVQVHDYRAVMGELGKDLGVVAASSFGD